MKKLIFTMMAFVVFVLQGRAQTVKTLPFTPNDAVNKIVNKGDTVIIGGYFSELVYNTDPAKVGRYGTLLSRAGVPNGLWAQPNAAVKVAIPDGLGGVFIGGDFTKVGAEYRNRVAHIDANGNVSPLLAGVNFKPLYAGATDQVLSLCLRNDTLYVGGAFTAAGDIDKPLLLNTTGFLFESATGNVNPAIRSVTATNVTAAVGDGAGGWFIAGVITKVGDSTRTNIAHIDVSGNVLPWKPALTGTVYALEYDGTNLYVGGNGLVVQGVSYRGLVAINGTTGSVAPLNFMANNAVRYLGIYNNNLYAGGLFDSIGGKYRTRLASLPLGSDTATNWNPYITGTSSIVMDVDIANGNAYVVGRFDSIGGQARNRIGAVDLVTGMATSWNPNAGVNASQAVNAIKIANNMAYVGGSFTKLGDSTCSYFGAVDLNAGLLIPGWARTITGTAANNIDDIKELNGTVYITGKFTGINGAVPNMPYLASLDAATGLPVQGKVPAIAAQGATLALQGSTFFVGLVGNSATVAGITRTGAAAFNINTGLLCSWSPGMPGSHYFRSMVAKDTTIYCGMSGGNGRLRAVSAYTGSESTWVPTLSGFGDIRALALTGDTLYVGGTFTTIDGQPRNSLAAFNITTKTILPWNPNADLTINCLLVTDNAVYTGGYFSNVGGKPRKALAALDRSTGLAKNWNANVTQGALVISLAMKDSTLYAGGSFGNGSTVGGKIKWGVAALNMNKDTLMAVPNWDPKATGGNVDALAITNNELYAAGSYTSIATTTYRNGLAAFSASTGEVHTWTPQMPEYTSINSLALSPDQNTLYLGGYFNNIGDSTRMNMGSIDLTSGGITTWNPSVGGGVSSIIPSGNRVYIGGPFIAVKGTTRNSLAALDANDASVITSWNPNVLPQYSDMREMILKGNTIYVCGGFTSVGGLTRNNLAAVDVNTGLPTSWNPNANGMVYSIVSDNNTLYAGGFFTQIGGQTRNRLAAINMNDTGTLVTGFDPNVANGTVNALALKGFSLYAGGTFTTTVGGLTKPGVALINSLTGAVHAPWAGSGFASNVNCIGLVGTTVYLGMTSQPFMKGLSEEALLPVSFLNIHASRSGADVRVLWSTASEQNNNYFEVERSYDNKLFVAVGSPVKGAGNSNVLNKYAFTDNNVKAGVTVYYRVKQVDFDGQFAYSGVVTVKATSDKNALDVSLYPNPSKGIFTLDFTEEGTKEIEIYDMNGQLLHQQTVTSLQEIINLNTAKTGIFLVKVSADGKHRTAKLIVE